MRDVASDLIYELEGRLRIVNIPVGKDLGEDHTRLINSEMKLLTTTSAAASILGGRPLAFTDDRQSCAVDDELNGRVAPNSMQIYIEILATPRERGVIWRFEIESHQRKH